MSQQFLRNIPAINDLGHPQGIPQRATMVTRLLCFFQLKTNQKRSSDHASIVSSSTTAREAGIKLSDNTKLIPQEVAVIPAPSGNTTNPEMQEAELPHGPFSQAKAPGTAPMLHGQTAVTRQPYENIGSVEETQSKRLEVITSHASTLGINGNTERELESVLQLRAACVKRQEEVEAMMREILIQAGERQQHYLEVERESSQLLDNIEAYDKRLRSLAGSMTDIPPSLQAIIGTTRMNWTELEASPYST